MAERKGSATLAVIGWLGGIIERSRRQRRERPLHVTVYSEPGYRGESRVLESLDIGVFEKTYSLEEIGLPRLGSIKLERYTDRFLPALDPPADLYSALSSPGEPEAFAWSQVAIASLPRMLNPRAWLAARDPEADRQSWARLWPDRPKHPLPPIDQARGGQPEPWRELIVDTPDLGAWGTRVRYLELGVSNPNHMNSGVPDSEGWG